MSHLFETYFEDAECGSGTDHKWNYENDGPDAWPHFQKQCKGAKQSPIDIVKANTEHDKKLRPFVLRNYDEIFYWNVTHNGHGGIHFLNNKSTYFALLKFFSTFINFKVVVTMLDNSPENKISVQGSDFERPYELLQFHLHWGYNNFQGSEHYVNGQKFPLEVWQIKN